MAHINLTYLGFSYFFCVPLCQGQPDTLFLDHFPSGRGPGPVCLARRYNGGGGREGAGRNRQEELDGTSLGAAAQ